MKAKILRNTKKSWTSKAEKERISFLKKNKVQIVKQGADVTICLGGDGTIFYFNHIGKIEGSVLAIGTDSSHICQLKNHNWKSKLLIFLKRNKTESRITLNVIIGKKKFSAINDVVLHTVDYRVIETTVKINNSKKSFDGDGIIIATPTGSTAYAYSAGGLIIDEKAEAIEVVPICPYKRSVAPSIVHNDRRITFYADRVSDLVIDGIFIKKLKPKESVKVEKGKNISFLV